MILIERLKTASEQHKGTDVGGLFAWAAEHIDDQHQALSEAMDTADKEQNERIRLGNALHTASGLLRQALGAIADAMPAYVDISRDTSHHVNLMAVAHGDPDYGTEQKPQKHVDVRGVAPRKVKRPTMAPFTEAGRRKVEAAAKAAGYQWRGFSAAGEPMLNEDVSKPHPRFVVPTFWNPRDNDGDSRRLASDMDMTVTVRQHEVEVFHDELEYQVSMAFGVCENRHEVVRLAVLEAAARVGDAV